MWGKTMPLEKTQSLPARLPEITWWYCILYRYNNIQYIYINRYIDIYRYIYIDIEDIVNFLRPCRTAPLPVSALGSLASGLGSRQLFRCGIAVTSWPATATKRPLCAWDAGKGFLAQHALLETSARIRIWWHICGLFRLPLECGSLEWWPVWFHLRTALWPRLLHWHQPLCWPTHGHDLRIARSW